MTTQETSEQKQTGTKVGKRYRCAKRGSEVLVTRPGQGALTCCGEAMQLK